MASQPVRSGALAKRELADRLPEGPKIAFGGGAGWYDIDVMRRVLDRVQRRYPDIVLCHGGQTHSAEVAAGLTAAVLFPGNGTSLDLERGNRLVGHDQRGFERQGLGDCNLRVHALRQ